MDDLLMRIGWNLVLCVPFGVLVWCLCRLPKIHARPAVCHGLWLLVLLKMVTPPFVAVPVMPAASTSQPAASISSDDQFSTSVDAPTAISESEPTSTDGSSTVQENRAVEPVGPPTPPVLAATVSHAPGRSTIAFWRIAKIAGVLISLTTTLGLWFVAFRQLRRLQRLLTSHESRSDRATERLAKLAPQFRLRTIPRLVVVDSAIAPVVWAGPRRLVIVLSEQLIQSLDDDQLDHVLAHELAHLERGDHWSNLFGFFVATLFWWHPVAWLARREVCLAAESCCDAMALERCSGSRKTYAQTLLGVVDFVDGGKCSRPALVLNFDGTSSLRKRIQMLANSAVRTRISIGGWLLILLVAASLALLPIRAQEATPEKSDENITVAPVRSKAVTLTKQFVCQIQSHRYIKVRAPARGHLEATSIKESQAVKTGDVLFTIQSPANQAKLDGMKADLQLAKLEYDYTKSLSEKKVVSPTEVLLLEAKLKKAQAQVAQAEAELNAGFVRAPFDGIVDRALLDPGSLVEDGEVLTTLSDNSTVWAYYNVPEGMYLEHAADTDPHKNDVKIELKLANGKKFNQIGKLDTTFYSNFDPKTGNMPLRAAFPNPERLLRHGQTGVVTISRAPIDAITIPQRAVFEVVQKRYVYVVDKDDVAHLREVIIQNESDDMFVIKSGVSVGDKIVIDGVKDVHDGEKIKYEDR